MGQLLKPAFMRSIFIVAAFLLAMTACTKSSSVSAHGPLNDSLPGKWWYSEYYYSIGSPGSWHTINPVTQWIELHANGELHTNMTQLRTATGYLLPDSNQIKFIIPASQDGYLLYQYRFDDLHALILSPLNPICIEGCASKFRR